MELYNTRMHLVTEKIKFIEIVTKKRVINSSLLVLN